MKEKTKKFKCDECGENMPLPNDAEVDEIYDCKCCGTGYKVIQYKGNKVLSILELTGEDWGE